VPAPTKTKTFSLIKSVSMGHHLKGQIERITYTNEENGYSVLKLKVYGRKDLISAVGNMMAPTPGEILDLEGEWSNHPKFGEQFKITHYRTEVPATVYGIEKYLGSGLIKGIGPVMAKRIVRKFGESTLEVIEKTPEALVGVAGIGKKRIAMIKAAWEEQKEIREVMLFLQTHGVSSAYATKIFKQYGDQSISVVRENPYRLAMDIFGIGFVTADGIAEKLGFDKECQVRAEAGILYILHQLADEGHVYYPYEPLIQKCREMLEIHRELITQAISSNVIAGRIVLEDLNTDSEKFLENNKGVFLKKFHVSETGIAARIKRLQNAPKAIRTIDAEKAVKWVQQRLDISLASNQVEAIREAAHSKVLVVTGGPGTGKTTIINAVLKIFSPLKIRMQLAAPTGRAAKRMSEATGHEAMTLHRLLEYSMAKGGFQKDQKHPLHCDLLIVDEASMIDTILMHHLLKAIPLGATFILVGDIHQLPSVGAGNVLKDIMASASIPVVALDRIFRQARESRIIVNAHRINSGRMPSFQNLKEKSDFFFIDQEDPERVLNTILDLTSRRVPSYFGLDPMKEIQVLTPMHRGIVGAGNLNLALQNRLNPNTKGVERGNRVFRTGDKVMQIKNNYDKEVFNGDMGRIVRLDPETREMTIAFEDRELPYDFSDLDEIILAYAVSVHKSQGSEYPAVIIPILIQHYMLLQRNLIYTAVTRGKKLVILVGTRKALAIGIRNDKTLKRYTLLEKRLKS